MLDPATETRPWAEQLALDDVAYREQLAYLYERSPFYRAKLAEAGFASAGAAGGLAEIAQLPPTEKAELKATATPDNPSAPISAPSAARSCASTPPAARPGRPATSR